MAAAWPDEGSRQKVHYGLRVTSPMPLSVWSLPPRENVSRRKNCVPSSMSTVLLSPAERIEVPNARALYWFGAVVSGAIPSENASILRRIPPGSIVWVVSVTWALNPGTHANETKRAKTIGERINLRWVGIRGRVAAPQAPVTTKNNPRGPPA